VGKHQLNLCQNSRLSIQTILMDSLQQSINRSSSVEEVRKKRKLKAM